MKSLQVDLISVSGHKIFGPQGIGALVIRGRAPERGLTEPLKSGSQFEKFDSVPIALAVGLGMAATIAQDEHVARRDAALDLRARFVEGLQRIDYSINGDPLHCQPHVLNASFHGIDSEAFMIALRDEIAISNGAVTKGTTYQPCAVLRAMGVSESRVAEAVRFSWGPASLRSHSNRSPDPLKFSIRRDVRGCDVDAVEVTVENWK